MGENKENVLQGNFVTIKKFCKVKDATKRSYLLLAPLSTRMFAPFWDLWQSNVIATSMKNDNFYDDGKVLIIEKIMWDFNKQTDKMIECQRSYIVVHGVEKGEYLCSSSFVDISSYIDHTFTCIYLILQLILLLVNPSARQLIYLLFYPFSIYLSHKSIIPSLIIL